MTDTPTPAKPRPKLRKALTPKLKKLFYVLAVGIGLLGANSVYLSAITFSGFVRGETFENQFYLFMFLLHLALGVLLTVPFVVFGAVHIRNTYNRKNRTAVRLGYLLFGLCLGVIVTGLVMTVRLAPLDSLTGRLTYWLHVTLPVFAILAYVVHRMYGPRIRWKYGVIYGVSVAVVVGLMAVLHTQDPRQWNIRGGGEEYFHPSEARTATGGWIPAEALMMDQYCQECHPDAYDAHYSSVHHFSSFNNPPYLFSVRETRQAMLDRDSTVQGARFCAGCHDPVPFFSGAFDDPNFDDENDPTAHEGITCTVCHAITDVHGSIGNANYTIEEPLHYPFAYSDNSLLKWINRQLVKAKPAFHKKTFLKPLHKQGEFCATCHKVSLPEELNDYKWLRGQNHWDNFLLSGVHGGGATSFYYPPKAHENCNRCHMPLTKSDDFGNIAGEIHDHRFPGSNTGVPFILGMPEQVAYQRDFLEDEQVHIDIFGVREGGSVGGKLKAPIRPQLPALQPGNSYLLEVVIRTLKVGHIFTQGTADSNELWVEVLARNGERVVGRSGAMDDEGTVDSWSHFVNAYVLDRQGQRIDRRNAQDIFVPLYSNQQPPGTGQVVHYRLDVPADATGEIEVEVKLNYRKFDRTYMEFVYDDLRERGKHDGPTPNLPIAVMASDRVTFPVGDAPYSGDGAEVKLSKPQWQRWRDYGIGLFRKGNAGADKGELKQATEAFQKVVELGRPEGWVDLARVFEKEGRVEEARQALQKAIDAGLESTWTINWLAGLIDKQNGHLDRAIASFRKVLSTRVDERGFDFSKDYRIWNLLGETLLQRALQGTDDAEQQRFTQEAIDALQHTLALESENATAHYNLKKCYGILGNQEKFQHHSALHAKYAEDNNARDGIRALHKNPAALHAANAVVIYDLSRDSKK